jgi:hypothetical protein
MIKEIKKIELPNTNLDFAQREKFINREISNLIEHYNNIGYTVISHSITNKSISGASVVFELKQMPS